MGLPGDTAERVLCWGGASEGSLRGRDSERDHRMGQAGKETKGPGAAGEGESWRRASNWEALGCLPCCIRVNNRCQSVPRAPLDPPWVSDAPPHTGIAG